MKELCMGAWTSGSGKLKEQFYWSSHYNDVQRQCVTCVSCATRKPKGPKRRGPLQPIIVGYPLQLVAVDIMGPLPQTSSKYNRSGRRLFY